MNVNSSSRSRGSMPASLLPSSLMRPDVREAEIIPFEKQRLAGDFRQGIGEAIAEIQSSRVAAALAEVAIGGGWRRFHAVPLVPTIAEL
jgi:hypothetical protein